jgi:inner membrane protein
MKWVNHMLIAGAIAVPFNPAGAVTAVIGATAPDWLEYVLKVLGVRGIKHRGVTHYFVYWVIGVFATFFIDWHGLIFWFAFGGMSHILCDALTVSGVPFGPWSDSRFHLFGGRIRTGQPTEYFVALFVVVVVAFFMHLHNPTQMGFIPFFYDWYSYYEEGLIDASELKRNRLNFF